MYAPSQGPVNTGFSQSVIDATATGSDIQKGQLVSISFNADGPPSCALCAATDAYNPTPIGVAGELIKQGFAGSVIIGGIGMMLVESTNTAVKTKVEAGAGVLIAPGASGAPALLGDGFGVVSCGLTTEAKATTNDLVPIAFSAYTRTQAATFESGNATATTRNAGNTYIPEHGKANRITLPQEVYDPIAGSYTNVFRESFYLAAGGSNPTSDVTLIDASDADRNAVSLVFNVGGFMLNHSAGAVQTLPFDSTSHSSGIRVTTSSGDMLLMRGGNVDDADDGYFVFVDYTEV
jgi:hypothetical protein